MVDPKRRVRQHRVLLRGRPPEPPRKDPRPKKGDERRFSGLGRLRKLDHRRLQGRDRPKQGPPDLRLARRTPWRPPRETSATRSTSPRRLLLFRDRQLRLATGKEEAGLLAERKKRDRFTDHGGRRARLYRAGEHRWRPEAPSATVVANPGVGGREEAPWRRRPQICRETRGRSKVGSLKYEQARQSTGGGTLPSTSAFLRGRGNGVAGMAPGRVRADLPRRSPGSVAGVGAGQLARRISRRLASSRVKGRGLRAPPVNTEARSHVKTEARRGRSAFREPGSTVGYARRKKREKYFEEPVFSPGFLLGASHSKEPGWRTDPWFCATADLAAISFEPGGSLYGGGGEVSERRFSRPRHAGQGGFFELADRFSGMSREVPRARFGGRPVVDQGCRPPIPYRCLVSSRGRGGGLVCWCCSRRRRCRLDGG